MRERPSGPRGGGLDETAPATAPTSVDVSLGRYQFRRLVGAGGMGVVIAAYDPELDREVAIKFVATDSDDGRARLVREAQAMARLSHPNVVAVHEVLWIDDRAGIVMELVAGEDLEQWHRRTRPGWRQILDAYVQAGHGLAAAHQAGLVHRDFKPKNALIDRRGLVRVTDFGLARAVPGGVVEALPLPLPPALATPALSTLARDITRTGALLGTPAYMAPEQHRGEAADARSDQWALACGLYEALYDRRPLGDGEETAPLLPPRAGGQAVPRYVRLALRRGLASARDDRFDDVEGFLAALTPHRKRWRLAVAALALCMVAAGVVVVKEREATCSGLDAPLLSVWNPKARARVRGVAERQGAGRSATHLLASLDDYAGRWVAARNHACVDGRRGVRSKDLLDRRMRCLDQHLTELTELVDGLGGEEPKRVAPLQDAVDQLHPVSDCDDPKEAVPRPASPQVRAAIASAEAELARGWAQQALGRYDKAEVFAVAATQVGQRSGFSPLAAQGLLLRGECADRQQRYAEALARYEEAAAAAAKARDDDLLVETLERQFLVIGEHLGRRSEALARRPFIELALERAGQPPSARAFWLHFLAILLYPDPTTREQAYQAEHEAVGLWRKMVSPTHVYLLDSLETEGNIQAHRHHFDEAKALLNEVLAGRITAHGEADLQVASALNNLGNVEEQRGHYLEALDYYERAVADSKTVGVEAIIPLSSRSSVEYRIGRWRSAEKTLERVLDAARRQVGKGASIRSAYPILALGELALARGALKEAERLLGRAAREFEQAGAVGELGLARAEQARVALRRGRADDASALIEAAERGPHEELVAVFRLAEAELAAKRSGCKRARPLYDVAITAARAEPDRAVESLAVVALANCELDAGDPAAARERLEPEVAWLEAAGADEEAAAPARLALARALLSTARDGTRIHSLPKTAHVRRLLVAPRPARRRID